jgi:hypothetical protein
MRTRLALVGFFFLFLTVLPWTDPTAQSSYWVVRAYYDDPQMIAEVAAWLGPWEVHSKEGYLVAGVDETGYARLEAMGFRVEVDEKLTAAINQPQRRLPGQASGIPGYPCYRTVDETFAAAQALAQRYPNLVTWSDIGDSWEKTASISEPGDDLWVLRLTNASIGGVKPKLFVMAALHGREYATAELVARFAEALLSNYGVLPNPTWVLDYHEIHLLLQANPDGRRQAELGQMWRKNTNQNYCSPTSPNRGADLNRNFDFLWSCCGGSSPYPCDETYRGPASASEPEVQAIQNYLRSQFSDQRGANLNDPAPASAKGLFIDVHSYGQLVLWPWSFTQQPAPNHTALQTLGRKLAYFNDYTPQQAIYLYPTDGSSDDFAYGELGLAAYTIEIGDWFFQSCADFELTVAPTNLQALNYAARVVAAPYQLPSGPDARSVKADSPVFLPAASATLTAVLDDTRYRSGSGEPVQTVAAAEFYIDTPPWITNTLPIPYAMIVEDGVWDEPIEQARAVIDLSSLAMGRHMLFVRGQDADGNWGPVTGEFLDLALSLYLPLIVR